MTDTTDQTKELHLEEVIATDYRIMKMMRQVLSSVARDTVPPPGMKHPLCEETIQKIRECLSVISSRERELGIEVGSTDHAKRPRFIDEPKAPVVSIDSLTKKQ